VTRKLLIHTVKDGDIWVNVRAGMTRPASSSATKALARSRARALARRTGRHHVVLRVDGNVATSVVYGRGSALLAG
jgi:hypothetical protein